MLAQLAFSSGINTISLTVSNSTLHYGQSETVTYTFSGGTPPYGYDVFMVNQSDRSQYIQNTGCYSSSNSTTISCTFTFTNATFAGASQIGFLLTDSSDPQNVATPHTTVNVTGTSGPSSTTSSATTFSTTTTIRSQSAVSCSTLSGCTASLLPGQNATIGNWTIELYNSYNQYGAILMIFYMGRLVASPGMQGQSPENFTSNGEILTVSILSSTTSSASFRLSVSLPIESTSTSTVTTTVPTTQPKPTTVKTTTSTVASATTTSTTVVTTLTPTTSTQSPTTTVATTTISSTSSSQPGILQQIWTAITNFFSHI